MLVAGAATAQAQPEACSSWQDVTAEPDYVEDGHLYVRAQMQTCEVDGQTQLYGRGLIHQLSENTWPYPVEAAHLRFYRNNGCVGCEPLYESGPMPEPGVGNTFTSPAVPITAGQTYGADTWITFVDPPSPGWIQTAVNEWTP
jgi:hypothetical protein